MSHGEKSRVVYEDERFRIIHRKRNGTKRPAYITLGKKHPETGEWDKGIRLSIDDLFDLTEALDDLCDEIEDRTYGKDIS